MKKGKLAEMLYKRVRIRPMARHTDPVGRHSVVDDDWIVIEASREVLAIENERTQHIARIGTDHVLEFRTGDGRIHGFLILKSLIYLSPRGVRFEPVLGA